MEGAYRLYAFFISQFRKAGEKNSMALEIFPPKLYDLTISWVDWCNFPGIIKRDLKSENNFG